VTATLPRPVRAGDDLQMFVRPAAVRLVGPTEAQFMAQVRDVAFAGRGYEHALVADGPLLLTRVFSERRFERGTSVGVSLSPQGCLVLAAESSVEPGTGGSPGGSSRGDGSSARPGATGPDDGVNGEFVDLASAVASRATPRSAG
jgi:hypothetical protein